jgi:cell wall-associated NlpC family hydrolase
VQLFLCFFCFVCFGPTTDGGVPIFLYMVYSVKVWGIDCSGLIYFTIVEVGVNLCLVNL